MTASCTSTICKCPIADDPEFMEAFQKALDDPETKKEILEILKEAGLFQE